MPIISVSGDAGCAQEELAALVAERLSAELLTTNTLESRIKTEFRGVDIPENARKYAVQSIVARAGARGTVVVCAPAAASALRDFEYAFRVHVGAQQRAASRKFDLALNGATFAPAQMADIVETAIRVRGLTEGAALQSMAHSQVEFQARLKLSKFGITPPQEDRAGQPRFTHPSEQIFANLLDFYRIRWEYEPRSFPLQWDKDGRVKEAFTPDFYLPEFDLYVELTTMKQSLVTKKNRKVRLLKAIYPHVNIQVFYQKDFQELISKYGLADRPD
jgi:hypothetical protein